MRAARRHHYERLKLRVARRQASWFRTPGPRELGIQANTPAYCSADWNRAPRYNRTQQKQDRDEMVRVGSNRR